MDTFMDEPTSRFVGLSAVEIDVPGLGPTATQAHPLLGWRRVALVTGLLAAPAVAGMIYGRATRKPGLLAGGLAAFALGALRVELARWFTPEPAFESDGQVGELELRQCAARIEAVTEIDDSKLEAALDHGYGQLASYVCGANRDRELLSRTTPVLTAMRDGRYTVAFVMPPGRTLDDLPRPEHPRIALREVPAHTLAALRFRGRFTRDNVAAHERALLRYVVDAGLATRGSIVFAAYDSPLTLPILRRNEVWIETV
jgi:hypothetical protein